VIFDTDILVWIQRGSAKAAVLVDKESDRCLSILSCMELLQTTNDKRQHYTVRDFLRLYGFRVLPLTENIGHRASIYIEEYSLSSGLRAGDAIIAATATENNMVLATGNGRHFKPIKDLSLKVFRP
jgi:predicted nucleic acid-binding protein